MAWMTLASIKSLLAFALVGLTALAVAGCGNDVPTGAVAKVGDSEITQDEFDKWLKTAVMGQAQGAAAAVPDPPDYAKCVAAKKKAPAPEGQSKPTDAALKKQCKAEYDQLKTEVMQFLIQAEWVQQEADQQNISVSEKAVAKSFEDQKKQAFPTDKAYSEFLKTSGMSEEDILFRVELDQLQQKLTKKVTEGSQKVTDAEIQEYYEKNQNRFAQPERRDLRVVLTKNEAKANQAKQALEDGDPWKQVVQEYSIDEASKAQAGRLPAVAKGQQEKALDDASFTAEKGSIEGPVKTQFGWYVFEVEKVTPAVAAVAGAVQGHDQEPAAPGGPAEGARQVHQGLPRGVQGADRLRRGLPHPRVQERSEGKPHPGPRGHGRPASAGAPGSAHPREPAALAPPVDDHLAAALARLDEITRRLRVECPWDREQDERSIVPHTVEEAYELADAAYSGDDAKLVDELGDVLFQVFFLSLLLEERGAGGLAEVAEACRAKLIRRHPHVFGDREAETARDVVRNWDQIKRDVESGGEVFGVDPGDPALDALREEDPPPRPKRRTRMGRSGG